MTTKHTPIRERIERHVERLPFSGCWVWMGPLSPNGYGRISIAGVGLKHAHRESFVAFKGPIPAGKVVQHTCRQKCCVNPGHLQAVTHSENMRYDYAASPWGNQNTSKTHCPRGHEYAGVNLRVIRGKRYCKACVNEQKRARRLQCK